MLPGGGVGAYGRETEAGEVRPAGPDLLAVDHPAAIDLDRAGLDAGGVGARFRLAEQLTPDDLLVECRAHPSRDLLRGRVLDQRQNDPARDVVVRTLDGSGAKLLLDDQLLDRAGVSPPRLGPGGHRVARLDQGGAALFRIQIRE